MHIRSDEWDGRGVHRGVKPFWFLDHHKLVTASLTPMPWKFSNSGGELYTGSAKARSRCGQDILIHVQYIVRIVLGLDLLQPRIIDAVGGRHGIATLIVAQVIDITA